MSSAVLYVVLAPFFGALFLGMSSLVGVRGNRCYEGVLALLCSLVSLVAALMTLSEAVHHYLMGAIPSAPLSYHMGGWQPPYGIEFRVDCLNALLLVFVSVTCFISTFSSLPEVMLESQSRRLYWYALSLLFQTGICGMVATGDLFNVYVFLEVAALTGYALLSFGGGRAYMATLHYLLIGSLGACFYLLGVGYLYAKTGTLNMADMHSLLFGSLMGSSAVKTASALCFLGLAIKLGMFPFHGWLPNVYTHATHRATALVAPLASKTAMYVAIRLALSVFPISLVTSQSVVVFASVGILGATILAFQQTSLKRMICYLMVAEAGYMVGGLWLGSRVAFTGAAYHVVADGLMTLSLFLVVSSAGIRVDATKFSELPIFFRSNLVAYGAFVVAGLSMIGVPPLPGFFSKWLLLRGSLEAGNWLFILALLGSSIGNLILFLRVFEFAYFQVDEPPSGEAAVPVCHYYTKVGLVLSSICLLAFGLMSSVTTQLITSSMDYSGYFQQQGR